MTSVRKGGFLALLFAAWTLHTIPAVQCGEPAVSVGEAEAITGMGKATLTREPDVVIIQGEKISRLCGRPIEHIRMLTLRNGGFQPIPFQIDEQNAEGTLVYPYGPKATRDEDPTFDRNDLLLFMAHDLGDQAAPGQSQGLCPVVEEVEVKEPQDGSRAWGYVVSSDAPPPRSDQDYVRYTIVEGKVDNVDAQHYSIHYPWGEYYTDTFFVPPTSGGNGVNFMDRLKARGTFKILFSVFSVRVTEDRMGSKVVAYIDGPVRVIRHVAYWANMGLGIRSPVFEADLTYYASFMKAPLTMRVPARLDLFVSEAYGDIGSDYNHHAYGLVFMNSNNPEGTIIDGRMSPQEEGLDLSMDEWRMVTGPQGTLLRGRMPQCELTRQVKTTVHYVDDYRVADPPEQEPGQIGHVFDRGDVTHLRPGIYQADLFLFIPPWYHDGEHDRYLNMEMAPLESSARALY